MEEGAFAPSAAQPRGGIFAPACVVHTALYYDFGHIGGTFRNPAWEIPSGSGIDTTPGGALARWWFDRSKHAADNYHHYLFPALLGARNATNEELVFDETTAPHRVGRRLRGRTEDDTLVPGVFALLQVRGPRYHLPYSLLW